MAGPTSRADKPQKPHLVSIGNFLALGYWIMEAYFDSILMEDASFAMRLFPSDPHELWTRSLVSGLFVAFGLYAHRAHVRIRSVERLNLDAAWLLRNALSNTIRGHFPICIHCKNIRDEDGRWIAPDRFISTQTEALLSRVVCDECDRETR